MIRLAFDSFSIDGPKGQNQDAILEPFVVDDTWWSAIADGVGGGDLGELASSFCIEFIKENVNGEPRIRELFEAIASGLQELQKTYEGKNLGSTLSVLAIRDRHAYVGHVGDTRIMQLRGEGIVTRTKDQTEVQKLADEGVLSPYQARRYPRRNVLFSVMSTRESFALIETGFDLETHDRILLTSDGFHSGIKKNQMVQFSKLHNEVGGLASSLKEAALAHGIKDDASVVAIEVTD